jgi:hypothetical protein
MPCVGFEATIPAYERAKTVHALDRSATVTGKHRCTPQHNSSLTYFTAFILSTAQTATVSLNINWGDLYNGDGIFFFLGMQEQRFKILFKQHHPMKG